jgi:hypothetical protein
MKLTVEAIRKRLRLACKEAGSQKLWARANGVSESYVSDVLLGRRMPGKKILAPLGFEKGEAEFTFRAVG